MKQYVWPFQGQNPDQRDLDANASRIEAAQRQIEELQRELRQYENYDAQQRSGLFCFNV